MNQTEKNIFEKVNQSVVDLGFELVEVRMEERQKAKSITIFIDNIKPVSIDDCVLVHRAVDSLIDELNPTNNASYTLNVSSLGLDWNIKTDRDFEKNMGKELVAKFFVPLDGKKQMTGVLVGYDTDIFELKIEDKTIKIERNKVCKLEKTF